MNKITKKFIFTAAMTIIFALLFVSVQAVPVSTDADFEYTYTGMTEEKAAMIISSWTTNPDEKIEIIPTGLLCLFGHSIQQDSITQTYHNVSSTSPRCKEIHKKIEYCSRSDCNYSKVLSETTYDEYCH